MADKATLILDAGSDGREIELSVGQDFEIRLQENPTAGFRWKSVRLGEPICTLLGQTYEPGGKRPGQPGMHSWRFRIVGEGTALLELAYARSWEATPTAAQTFSLRAVGKK